MLSTSYCINTFQWMRKSLNSFSKYPLLRLRHQKKKWFRLLRNNNLFNFLHIHFFTLYEFFTYTRTEFALINLSGRYTSKKFYLRGTRNHDSVSQLMIRKRCCSKGSLKICWWSYESNKEFDFGPTESGHRHESCKRKKKMAIQFASTALSKMKFWMKGVEKSPPYGKWEKWSGMI